MFEHGGLGCLPGNFNKMLKHEKMFISLKAMHFNSLLHFLETTSYAYFSFQSSFCSFPCIHFVQLFNTFLSLDLGFVFFFPP